MKLHGDLNIPQKFLVPSFTPWPTWSWQQKLGAQVKNIRTGTIKLSEEKKNVLNSMHFKWGPNRRNPPFCIRGWENTSCEEGPAKSSHGLQGEILGGQKERKG